MTNKNSTKRALFASAMALLLCFTMLLGTTYAWFTDSATSAGNKIVAGTLEVDLLMADARGTYASIAGEDAAIFGEGSLAQNNAQETLWEPGKTQIVYLGIENKGSLDLKYNIAIDVVDGGLIGSLEYAIIDGAKYGEITASDWETIKANAQTGDIVAGTTVAAPNGAIKADEDIEYFALAVHMKEDADNKYQGKDVTIDITVLATQLASESDSFGNEYDANAPFGTYIELNAGDDLLAAMASADADMPLTIKLNGDVEWPTEGHHGENDITPASSILIDGNGYTITATGSGVTPLGDTEAPMTLKNVKIVDNSVSYDESAWELSYLEMGGKVLNCVNVDFADPISVDSENATFTNCSFVGHYDKNSTSTTQYGVWVYNGNSTYTNCTFTGTRGMKICDQYAGEVGSVVINGCTFIDISEKPGVCIDDREAQDMNITIKNSTFINCKAGDQNLYIYETDNTVPTVENNTVLNNASVVDSTDDLADALVAGGDVVYTGSNLDIDTDLTVTGSLIITEAEITASADNELVVEGGSLTLGQGVVLSVDNEMPVGGVIRVTDGSEIVLAGSEITGCDNNGMGVLINVAAGAEMVIEDGTVISGNTVAGASNTPHALIKVSGTLTMNGGKISNNEFAHQALISIEGGKFVMNGGEITENKYIGTNSTSLIRLFTRTSTIVINDGTIANNSLGTNSSSAVFNTFSNRNAEALVVNGGIIKNNMVGNTDSFAYIDGFNSISIYSAADVSGVVNDYWNATIKDVNDIKK